VRFYFHRFRDNSDLVTRGSTDVRVWKRGCIAETTSECKQDNLCLAVASPAEVAISKCLTGNGISQPQTTLEVKLLCTNFPQVSHLIFLRSFNLKLPQFITDSSLWTLYWLVLQKVNEVTALWRNRIYVRPCVSSKQTKSMRGKASRISASFSFVLTSIREISNLVYNSQNDLEC